MKTGFLKRFISFLLILAIVFSLSVTLIGCNSGLDTDDGGNGAATDNSGSGNGTSNDTLDYDYHDKIKYPLYKDYGRDTVDFDKIEYKTPDFDAVNDEVRAVISAIEKNEITFEEQIALIEALEDDYSNILTMRTFADIHVSLDSSSEYWTKEFSYITGSYPLFASIIEDMYVAAANSPHAERFEAEYFGEGLIEEYKDGGRFTDELVALFEKEEELEARYTSISSTADTETLTELFIELIKTRRLIADELKYSTYADYAYEALGRDYSSDKASRLLDDICEYILPTYQVLSYTTLAKYVYQDSSVKATEIKLEYLINSARDLVGEVDERFGDIFDYMLQHGLFDVELMEDGRNTGAFVTYLVDYEAPFLFVSAEGNVTDYPTLLHEFGHFIDAFTNYNSDASIDQKEISSQALEYLMLTRLNSVLSASDTLYLRDTQMLNALMTLIFQGFYAKAEELIYALPYDKITKENLDAEIVKAAKAFSLNTNYINDVSAIFITHTFIYPFYVQSYCTSLIPALEIYFMEIENEGSGFEAYKKLIDRNGESFTLEEALEDAEIASPFKEDIVLELAGKILSYVSTGTLPEKNDAGLGDAA